MPQDIDGRGAIRYTEFLAATIEAHGAISEERLAEAFDRLDSDNSGFISAENLKEILGKDFPEDEIASIIKDVDQAKDGRISYSEFLAMWEKQHEEQRLAEIKVIQTLTLNDSDRSGESSLTGAGNDDVVSRANFIDAKLLAAVKNEETQVGKHVIFEEAAAITIS
jgi:hypothetical protein